MNKNDIFLSFDILSFTIYLRAYFRKAEHECGIDKKDIF